MGVIRAIANIQEPYGDSIEDVLEQIEEQNQQQEEENRRRRKIKHKSNNKLVAIGSVHATNTKSGKKKNRMENSNYLLTLADPEEAMHLTIHDFIPPAVSVFSQVVAQENLELWNEFVNCTDTDGWLQTVLIEQARQMVTADQSSSDIYEDCRSSHPAFSAADCFRKIDSELRLTLRKKHVPMGSLMYLERDLVTFFINRPQSVYQTHIPNSFERVLLHALCQYMDLAALSYNRNGDRWTRVCNNNPAFIHPAVLLSTYLEQRMNRVTRAR